jgi:hypothetical protein
MLPRSRVGGEQRPESTWVAFNCASTGITVQRLEKERRVVIDLISSQVLFVQRTSRCVCRCAVPVGADACHTQRPCLYSKRFGGMSLAGGEVGSPATVSPSPRPAPASDSLESDIYARTVKVRGPPMTSTTG